jgi:hypothetical protein
VDPIVDLTEAAPLVLVPGGVAGDRLRRTVGPEAEEEREKRDDRPRLVHRGVMHGPDERQPRHLVGDHHRVVAAPELAELDGLLGVLPGVDPTLAPGGVHVGAGSGVRVVAPPEGLLLVGLALADLLHPGGRPHAVDHQPLADAPAGEEVGEGRDHLHVGGDDADRVGEARHVAERRLVAAKLARAAVERREDVT